MEECCAVVRYMRWQCKDKSKFSDCVRLRAARRVCDFMECEGEEEEAGALNGELSTGINTQRTLSGQGAGGAPQGTLPVAGCWLPRTPAAPAPPAAPLPPPRLLSAPALAAAPAPATPRNGVRSWLPLCSVLCALCSVRAPQRICDLCAAASTRLQVQGGFKGAGAAAGDGGGARGLVPDSASSSIEHYLSRNSTNS
jgi:hypothetical protein